MGGEPDRGAALIVAKHRDGELDEIPMEFQGGFCRYEEAAPRSTGEADRGWL
jgi:replicative DNA helicase